ncbi:MAG TPA: DUF6049 family protein [Actinomycetota bacterium]|nr:DUF6049 family protein [Actinomycetota bacterium]
MSIHRALRASFALSLIVAACLLPAAGVHAQEPLVSLTLFSQTPVTTNSEPELELVVRAVNAGDTAIGDLSIGFTIGPRIVSRVLYEQTLTEGPGLTTIFANSYPQEGTLEPGQARLFTIRLNMVDIDAIAVALDSAVYPAQVDLRSSEAPLAALNTPLIHLVRAPEQPLELAWWTEVSGPIAFGPDGRLSDPSLEAAVAPEGALAMQADALLRMNEDPDLRSTIDLVVEPLLLDQLDRMADGYERNDGTTVPADQAPATNAATVLKTLRKVVERNAVQLSAMPFSAPLLPAMVSGGLADDLQDQRVVGAETTERLLGPAPVTSVARPPTGAIDDPAIDDLAAQGIGAVLANADAVDRTAQLNDFAPLPAATITTPSGASMDLVLPDPSVQGLLADPELIADPVRAAQAVLGEIATIWREQPVPGPQPDDSPTIRGVAVSLPASLPPTIWGPITRRLAGATFLEPLHAQDFAATVNPVEPALALAAPSTARFRPDYIEKLHDERKDVEAYRSMLVEDNPAPERLDRDLMIAEAGVYVFDELGGRRWIDQVNAFTDDVFQRVLPVDTQAFTLTSDEGSLPLRMGDPGDTPLQVQIQLRSSRFDFPDGNEQTVTLTEPDQVVVFTVQAKAAGSQTIKVRTRAPSGRSLAESNLTVRTTAVNSIAVIITGAAALLLVALWSRRYIRRPKS